MQDLGSSRWAWWFQIIVEVMDQWAKIKCLCTIFYFKMSVIHKWHSGCGPFPCHPPRQTHKWPSVLSELKDFKVTRQYSTCGYENIIIFIKLLSKKSVFSPKGNTLSYKIILYKHVSFIEIKITFYHFKGLHSKTSYFQWV